MDNTTYQPGDVANGHRLSDAGQWEPVEEAAPVESTTYKVGFKLGKTLVVVLGLLAVLLIGIGIGNASAGEDTTTKDALTTAQAKIEEQESKITDLSKQLQTLNGQKAALDARESLLKQDEAAVTAREQAITKTEQQAAANTIKGDGVYVVGQDMAAGEYRTDGPDGSNTVGCYYAFKDGTGSDANILDNNILNGQGRVTVKDGQVFETSSCKDWTKVG